MDYNSLPNFYAALDAKYNVTNNELNSATYTNVDCNFVYSAKYARHRWFNYKEGFSPILVEKIFNEYKLNKSSVVCDPFCGAGTTVAVAKAKGMKSIKRLRGAICDTRWKNLWKILHGAMEAERDVLSGRCAGGRLLKKGRCFCFQDVAVPLC